MKTRLRGFRVQVGLVASIICGSAVLSSTAFGQVKLELKYPPGRVLKHTLKIKTHQILTLNGMPIETEADEILVSKETIDKSREDSNLPLITQIESLKANISLPGGLNVAFDSADPDAKIEPAQLAFLGDVFRLISKVQFTVVLDKSNKLTAVEGTEAIQEESEKLGKLAKASIMGRFSPERLKTSFEQGQAKVPDILVRPGDSWDRTEVLELDSGQSLTFQKKYEYLGTEMKGNKTLDKIGVKVIGVKYGQDPNSESPLKVAESDLKIESTDGTLLFDREGGYFVNDHAKNRITGSMTFMAGGQKIPGELDLTLDLETEVAPPAK